MHLMKPNGEVEGRVWSGSVTHVPLKADVMFEFRSIANISG